MSQLSKIHATAVDDDQIQGPQGMREESVPDYRLSPFALADALRTIFPNMSAAESGICVSNSSQLSSHDGDKAVFK